MLPAERNTCTQLVIDFIDEHPYAMRLTKASSGHAEAADWLREWFCYTSRAATQLTPIVRDWFVNTCDWNAVASHMLAKFYRSQQP